MLKYAAVAVVALSIAHSSTPIPQGQSQRALSGDLTKPLEQYTGDEFAALVGAMRFGGGQQRPRICRGNPACAQARRTNVRVDASLDADSLTAGTIPQFGTVAIRAIVRGPDAEARYGMQSMGPGDRFIYYVVLTRGTTPGTTRWRLEELSNQGNVRAHRTIAEGQVVPCNHPFQRGARADFRTCAQSPANPAAFGLLTSLMQGTEPPIWYACGNGCCTIETGPQA